MPDPQLEERLAAVERALADGEETAPDPAGHDAAAIVGRIDGLEEDLADLEAAVQAVRGYVGSVKHVNDEVEQRADAAMAKVREIERTVAGAGGADTDTDQTVDRPVECCPRCGGAGGGVVDPGTRRRDGWVEGVEEHEQGSDSNRAPGTCPDDRPGDEFRPGGGRFGHQRLDAEEDSDGLIARLRGVLS